MIHSYEYLTATTQETVLCYNPKLFILRGDALIFYFYFELVLTSPTTQMVGVSPSTPRSQQFHASEGNVLVYSFLLASFSVCLHVELAHGCRAFICMHLFNWHVRPACVCVFVRTCVSTTVWRHRVSVKA